MNFVSIFILSILLSLNVKASFLKKNNTARDGIFNFSNGQNLENGISLKGRWNFYWKTFLNPEDIQKGIIPKAEKRETCSNYEMRVQDHGMKRCDCATRHRRTACPRPLILAKISVMHVILS